MSLLKDGRYEFRGTRGLVRDLRDYLIEEFEARNFEHRLHIDAPRAPEINHFAKDNDVVMVSCERQGDDYMLAVESEVTIEELDELIVEAAADLLVKVATQLFAHYEPAQTREALRHLDSAFSNRVKRTASETE